MRKSISPLFRGMPFLLATAFIASPFVFAQTAGPTQPASLTLATAENTALLNQPRMLAAQQRARAAGEQIREARSADFPTIGFNTTGVRVADPGTATAAGNITTSSISDRFAYGGTLSQLVTDFGRTHALVQQSRDQASAQADLAILTRAQVRLNVRTAYYQVLGAEAVLRAAQSAKATRELVAHQLTELSKSELRSTLDVQFATVLVEQADLAVVQAQSLVAQDRAHLATAMGLQQSIAAPLADESPAGDPLPASPDSLQHDAQTQRADLQAAVAQQSAAQHYAEAEQRLSWPKLTVLAAAGQIPYHDATLHDDYAAAGFNLNIPIFNGGLFAAQRAQAAHEASAAARDTQQVRLEVNEQVQSAWYRAEEAFQSIAVTAKLVAASREALRLAQDRYDAGLGSIVELNEAQLNETSAEIQAADANYTYLTRRAQLDFATGQLN
ncbi:TolC family protein [Silvibacterium dinghuense]|nr:TolC family protein [Silvibacterium dinghuense]